MKATQHMGRRLCTPRSLPLLVVLLTLTFGGTGCSDPPPEQEGAGEVQADVRPDNNVVSPLIIVLPLLNCAEAVTVKGFVSGARIRIYLNGAELLSVTGRDPEGETIPLGRSLIGTDRVKATQEVDGVEGDGDEKTVQDILEAYPSGLPEPRLPALPLYRCGMATYADNLPPGGKLRIFDQTSEDAPRDPIGAADGVGPGQSVGIGPPFQEGHWVSAQSQICTVSSGYSARQQVQPAPATLRTPQVTGVYENGQILTVNQLTNGSKVTIQVGGIVLGGGGAPGEHVRFWLSRPVVTGEHIEIGEELCPGLTSQTTVDVQPCTALPAPRIAAPWPGDDVVFVIDPVAGSRIRVYVAGVEIGDGGGSQVRLTRPLADGEEVIVTQSLGNCSARTAWRVRVGRGLHDPTAPGACGEPVQWEYGHQNDRNRRTTDVSGYFNSPDFRVDIQMNAVPLHGVVRHPRGSGPYPLVLIVHGNHDPRDPSYSGYDYLLDLLASHCMIAVSIEEDFLNGFVTGDMDARGIVLLRHLQLWREWNQTPDHPFFAKADMSRIGLSGHSRGGEAIVAANLLNSRDHDPGNAAQNFGFAIKSLYAIAPVDGQFDGGSITLREGADYYTMHGSHDGDVFTFGGLSMYNRAYPVQQPTAQTKGFVFVHGANHGQWNSRWETCCEDDVAPAGLPLIPSNDQKQIGKAYMSAFFKMSLQGDVGYKHFLNGDATFSTLPSSVVRVFQYQDPQRTFIDHYQEDTNAGSASIAGGTNQTVGTFSINEELRFNSRNPPHFLWGDQNAQGLLLGWQGSANPEYRVDLTGRTDALPDRRFLAFHVGQAHEDPRNLNDPTANQDFSVQLQFGERAGPAVAVSTYAQLRYPALTGQILRNGMLRNTIKSILRTVRIPFADLRADARQRPRDVTQIVLRFNRRASGKLVFDEIQFTD